MHEKMTCFHLNKLVQSNLWTYLIKAILSLYLGRVGENWYSYVQKSYVPELMCKEVKVLKGFF